METIIFRQGGLSQKVEARALDGPCKIKLGRSFKNDYIISDPYIAPFQLEIIIDSLEWKLFLVDHTNPTLLNGKRVAANPVSLHPGDEVTIGKSSIQVYDEEFAVEPTRELSIANWIHNSKFKAFIVMAAMVSLFLAGLYAAALTNYVEPEWGKLAALSLTYPVVVFAWACIWSLAGKFLRQHHYFLSHLFFASLTGIGLIIFSDFSSYIDYIFNAEMIAEIIDWLLLALIIGLSIGFSLNLATNIRKPFPMGVLIGCCFVGLIGLIEYLNGEQYSDQPAYSSSIKPPFVVTFNDSSTKSHIQGYQDIFEQLTAQTKP